MPRLLDSAFAIGCVLAGGAACGDAPAPVPYGDMIEGLRAGEIRELELCRAGPDLYRYRYTPVGGEPSRALGPQLPDDLESTFRLRVHDRARCPF